MTDISCWSCGTRNVIDDGPPYRCPRCDGTLKRGFASWDKTLDIEAKVRSRDRLPPLGHDDTSALAQFLEVDQVAILDHLGLPPAQIEVNLLASDGQTTAGPLGRLPEGSGNPPTMPTGLSALTRVFISQKPTVEVDEQRPYVAIPLNIEPSDEWIHRFKASLSLPADWTLAFDSHRMTLVGPMTNIESVLGLIAVGMESANDPAAIAQAELDQWWASHGSQPLEPELPKPDEPGGKRYEADQPSGPDEKTGDAILRWSLGLGIASVFVGYWIGLLPIATVIVSIIALVITPEVHPDKWKGGAGLALGIVFTFFYLYNYGYFY